MSLPFPLNWKGPVLRCVRKGESCVQSLDPEVPGRSSLEAGSSVCRWAVAMCEQYTQNKTGTKPVDLMVKTSHHDQPGPGKATVAEGLQDLVALCRRALVTTHWSL